MSIGQCLLRNFGDQILKKMNSDRDTVFTKTGFLFFTKIRHALYHFVLSHFTTNFLE